MHILLRALTTEDRLSLGTQTELHSTSVYFDPRTLLIEVSLLDLKEPFYEVYHEACTPHAPPGERQLL